LKETRHSSLLARKIHRIARIIPCWKNHPVRIVLWVCANRTLRESSVNCSHGRVQRWWNTGNLSESPPVGLGTKPW